MRGESELIGARTPINPELFNEVSAERTHIFNHNNFEVGLPLLECTLLNRSSIGWYELDRILGTTNSPQYINCYRTNLVKLLQSYKFNLDRLEVIITDRVTLKKPNGRSARVGFYRLHPKVKQYLISVGRAELCD